MLTRESYSREIERVINDITQAARHLSDQKFGGLIILRRLDPLHEYVETGVRLEARVTPEMLIQIFYPRTPLHDGGVVISEERIEAAGCVLPLSSSGVLEESPGRSMGLRHRAALGTAEESDAVAIVISEETGIISLAYDGKIDKYVSLDELEKRLLMFYRPPEQDQTFWSRVKSSFEGLFE